MTDALKPCPFCGSNPHEARPMIYGGWAVTCKCGARGPSFREDLATEHKRGTHSKASEAWNRRAQHQEPPQQEPIEAERVCAEAYAVVGCLLSDLGLLETEQASKILDNLWAARIVHHDVLPWRSYESHCISEKPQEKRPDRWCSKNECRMIGGCSRKPIQVAKHQEQPQQERKPLTESAIQQIGLDMPSLLHPGWLIEFARAIERAHGITED